VKQDTDNTKKEIPAVITPIEIIEKCGRLKYPISKVLNILYSHDKNIDIRNMEIRLVTEGTAEFDAYRSGMDRGDYEIDEARYADATSGSKTSVDSQNTLHDLQRERAINDAINDKFFPEGD
jgi:hypothetical protein